jgi:SAM-dependent methyltransferase
VAGYNPDDFQRVSAVEDGHFWFVARNRVLAAALSTMPRAASPVRSILEVGCGTGNTLRVLRAAFPSATLVGIDVFLTGLTCARQRTREPLVQATVAQLPFHRPFDLIGVFDVLEHLDDDRAALGHVRRMLRPGGTLIVTVPAGPALWSRIDDESHHRRRYEPRQLGDTLAASGFHLEYQTYFMAGIYPLVWTARRVSALRDLATTRGNGSHSALARELTIVPGLNRALLWRLAPEPAWVARRRQLPFGTSLLAIART